MSLIGEILDFLAPRHCVICDRRLAVSEEHICTTCLWHLPRTNYHLDPKENEMAKLFWGRFPIEKAAAWFFYKGDSEPTRMILDLKYHGNKQIGEWMGRVYAQEVERGERAFADGQNAGERGEGFFEGIDCIIPVPVSRWHGFVRGYNQSLIIAKGISEVTGIPVIKDAIKRKEFSGTQTRLHSIQRVENVRNAFRLTHSHKRLQQLEGKHILLVDDVVTTGSTIATCAEHLSKIPGTRISILSIGRTEL